MREQGVFADDGGEVGVSSDEGVEEFERRGGEVHDKVRDELG